MKTRTLATAFLTLGLAACSSGSFHINGQFDPPFAPPVEVGITGTIGGGGEETVTAPAPEVGK